MDASTVPLVQSSVFFDSAQYTLTGTYFFKDRSNIDAINYLDAAIIARLLPLTTKLIDPLFSVNRLTTKTMSNSFFQGWKHMADPSLFAINKNKHFATVFNTMPLSMWDSTLKVMLPHDLVRYWLAMAIAGDENYAYNKHPAGAAGRYKSRIVGAFGHKDDTHRICASQLAHISDQEQLLWIGPSSRYCTRNAWDKQRHEPYYKNVPDITLETLFAEPHRLEAAIVPPSLPGLWKPMLPSSKQSLQHADTALSSVLSDRTILGQVTSHGKASNWVRPGSCLGAEYCAYKLVNSFTGESRAEEGHFFTFLKLDVARYTYLGKLWLNLGVPRNWETQDKQ